MALTTVDCPYCSTESSVSIPDGARVKKVQQSYRTGVWGDAKKSEGSCADGHHFAIKYE